MLQNKFFKFTPLDEKVLYNYRTTFSSNGSPDKKKLYEAIPCSRQKSHGKVLIGFSTKQAIYIKPEMREMSFNNLQSCRR